MPNNNEAESRLAGVSDSAAIGEVRFLHGKKLVPPIRVLCMDVQQKAELTSFLCKDKAVEGFEITWSQLAVLPKAQGALSERSERSGER